MSHIENDKIFKKRRHLSRRAELKRVTKQRDDWYKKWVQEWKINGLMQRPLRDEIKTLGIEHAALVMKYAQLVKERDELLKLVGPVRPKKWWELFS